MHALVRVLPTFGAAKSNRPHAGASPAFAEDSRSKAIADAEARGFDGGLQAARQEYEARLDEAKEDFERQIRDARTGWAEEEGRQLAEAIEMSLCALEARLADSVAGVLLPLLDQALAAKAISEIESAIRSIASPERQPFIKISGREDLLEALRVRLGDLAAGFAFAPEASAAGVTLLAGDTIIEADLKAWSEVLSKSIGESGHG